MRNNKKICAAIYVLLASLFLSALPGCSASESPTPLAAATDEGVPVEKVKNPSIDDAPLVDNSYLYSDEDSGSVVTMYLTVSRGDAAENTDHSWTEINSHSTAYYANLGIPRYQDECLLQIGDEKGPVAGQLGYGLQVPNATVQVRGATSSEMPQKSYKIKLNKGSDEWRDQRTILLNKHIFDGLRFRNKLYYDLMEDIPSLISLRTQFVHLYVKDDTDGPSKGFADYGLYTQAEAPDGHFLKNHGLDIKAQLYKMNFFEFYRYPDEIRLKSDPKYDVKKFESILKIKGNDDHSKLIAMLDDVNDYSKPIEEVFDKYFDADNYFTWIAFNILMGNIDSQSRNNYLYSPQNSDKWYYIAWDCDTSLTRYEYNLTDPSRIGYEYGISNYWGDVLFSRVMQIPKYRAMLNEKVEAVRKIVTPQKINSMAGVYEQVVKKYLFKMPDLMNSELNQKQYDAMAATFANELDLNYNLYKSSLRMPMPFYLDVPAIKNGQLYFKWDPAFDLNGEDVTYTFELARDYNMKDLITSAKGLSFPTITTGTLKPGKYFFRVRATNEDGYTQYAMVYYVVHNVKYYGVQCFYMLKDGTISIEEKHEQG
jgi:spore coat protein H